MVDRPGHPVELGVQRDRRVLQRIRQVRRPLPHGRQLHLLARYTGHQQQRLGVQVRVDRGRQVGVLVEDDHDRGVGLLVAGKRGLDGPPVGVVRPAGDLDLLHGERRVGQPERGGEPALVGGAGCPVAQGTHERLGHALGGVRRNHHDLRRPGGEAVPAERSVSRQPTPGDRVLLGAGRVEAVRHSRGPLNAAASGAVTHRQLLPDPAVQAHPEGDRRQATEEPAHVRKHRGDARTAQQLALQGRAVSLERGVPVTQQLPQTAGERLL